MIELTVLSAVIVLFKAAFAGEDLDRKVGAEVVSTVLGGLLKTTSAADPVLRQIRNDLKELKTASYEDAMEAGHRYLSEAQLGGATREKRLELARAQLVTAAAAAVRLKVPILTGNAEFAIAQCDALLAAPQDADMALRRAAAAMEQGMDNLDVSGSRWRLLVEAKQRQDGSVSEWITRLGSNDLVTKGQVAAAETQAQETMASLRSLTDLYSQIQAATLAAAGHSSVVKWEPPPGEDIRSGLRNVAVAVTHSGETVCGFGLTAAVERVVVWRPEDQLVADLLLRLTARDDSQLRGTARTATHKPTPVNPHAASIRAADSGPWLLGKPSAATFNVGKGSYRGWLRVPAQTDSLEHVDLTISRLVEGRYKPTRSCIRVPVQPRFAGRPLLGRD